MIYGTLKAPKNQKLRPQAPNAWRPQAPKLMFNNVWRPQGTEEPKLAPSSTGCLAPSITETDV